MVGAGPLEPLLRLPGVTDVLVNGPEQVFVDRGAGLELTSVRSPMTALYVASRSGWPRKAGADSTTHPPTST